MCGIVAVWSPSGGLALPDIAPLVDAVRHRGPDGTGSWCSPTGRVVLGHARLAIIDLTTGDQPIATDGEALQIIVNGEFYGYEAIRDELVRRGQTLTTRTDSEIALHLYALDGDRSLSRLRGEFAFVIWNERRGELVAVRDRFGIKPLYYAEHAGRLYLASEVKALLAAGVPARWDVDAFADHLQIAVPEDRSLFAGVRQVPPGAMLVAGERGVRLRRYWDLDYPEQSQMGPPGSLEDYVDEVGRVLTDAVLVRTRADVPVCYHLSGGLDSSSVLAIGRRAGPATAFTVRFDDLAYDESEVASRTAAFLGASHHQIDCRRSDFADRLVAAVRAGEMIQENSHGVARYLQSEGIRRHGFKVVLAGEGGDELFAGYPQFQRDLALTLSPEARMRATSGYAQLAAVGIPPHLQGLLTELGLVPTWILDRYMNVTQPIRALLRDDFADRLAARDASAELLGNASHQIAGRAFVHQSMYSFAKSWFCNYILAAERLDMAHGLEVRLPFLDHQLFESVKATPFEWLAPGGQTKFPLRTAMRPSLPAEVADGGKQGFFAPPVTDDERMLSTLRELVGGSELKENPFFDQRRVEETFRRMTDCLPPERARFERLLQIVAGTCVLGHEFGMVA